MEALPSGSNSTSALQRGAWLAVGLLFPVALLNYLDRQMMAAMKDSVMANIPDIGSEAHWGMLAAVFKWVYAGLSPLGGYIADRTSRRRLIILSLGVWSAVTWATGHTYTYQQMLITRALMGISEACYIPAALALIADFHPGATRSRAVGIHQMGIYSGIALGGFTGYVADDPNLSWRAAFSGCGLIGVCYALLLFFSLREPVQENERHQGRSDSMPVGRTLAELLTNGRFLLLVFYFTLPALAGWVVKDWMPPILKQKYHLGQGQAGVSATLYVTLASLCGALLGGFLADRWRRISWRGVIYASALGMSLCIPTLCGVGWEGTPYFMALVCLVIFGLGWGIYDANNMPILCQIVRPELRATGYGIMNLVSTSGGALATWQVGVMRDAGKPPAVIFLICSGAATIAIGLVLLIRRKPQDAT